MELTYNQAVTIFLIGLMTSLSLVVYVVSQYLRFKHKDPFQDEI